MDKAAQEKILASVKNLQAKFRANLRERFDAVETNWARAKDNPADAILQKELYRSVHSMAGSSGTFGVPEVGDSARQLLNAIKPWQQQLESGEAGGDTLEIEDCLASLRLVIEDTATD